MTFGAPEMAIFFLLVPAAGLLLWLGARARRRRLAAWAQAETAARLVRGVVPWRRRLRGVLLLLGLAACGLALVRPQWGYHYEEVARRGIDLVLVVDVSESMLADDVSPSRLERAKREISDFLDLVQGDRIALVAAAGTSFVQCPLTLDYAAVREFLQLVDTDLIPTPGTDLGAALTTAAEAFEPSGPSRGKGIVLISDGGNLESDPEAVATELHETHGITMYTVGIGNPDEAVPIRTADGSLKEYLGKVVTTRLEESTLKRVAHAGGGVYVRAVTGDLDLEKIYADIRERHTAAELGKTRRKVYHERFAWPLAVGLLCLALEAGLSDRGRTASAAGLALLLATPASADVSGDVARGMRAYDAADYPAAVEAFTQAADMAPDDPRTTFNLGTAEYQAGNYAAALARFQATATAADPLLRAQGLYNAGNSAAQLGQLDEAVEAYERTLRLDPTDMDAKANLELVRRLIEEREQEQEDRKEEQQQQEQEQQQQDQEQAEDGEPSEQQQDEQLPPQDQHQQPEEQQQSAESEQGEPPQPEPGEEQAHEQQPSPQPSAAPEESEEQENADAQPVPAPGEMTQAEAEQWLQQLPADDAEALKDFWRRQQPHPGGAGRRDW